MTNAGKGLFPAIRHLLSRDNTKNMDNKRQKPFVDFSQLLPGDILLTTSKGWTSFGIRLITWSKYSHALLYIGSGEVIQSTPNQGIAMSSLDILKVESTQACQEKVFCTLPGAKIIHVFRHKQLAITASSGNAIQNNLMASINNAALENWGYDYSKLEKFANVFWRPLQKVVRPLLQLAGLIADKNKIAPGAFCSHLVAKILDTIGLTPIANVNSETVSPGAICRHKNSAMLRQQQIEIRPDPFVICDQNRLDFYRSLKSATVSEQFNSYVRVQRQTFARLDQFDREMKSQTAKLNRFVIANKNLDTRQSRWRWPFRWPKN